MSIRTNTTVAAIALSLASVAVAAPPAAAAPAPEQTVMTLAVNPSSVQEGGSVSVTATVRTASGAPVTTGRVEFLQDVLSCDGPTVALDGTGTATGTVPMLSGGNRVRAYYYSDGTYLETSASAPVLSQYVPLPTSLKLSAYDNGAGGVTLASTVDAQWHWGCAPDDDGADGTTDFFEGRRHLGNDFGGVYRDAEVPTTLAPGTHQIRTVFAPSLLFDQVAWTGTSSTRNVTVSSSGLTITDELVLNPSFEQDTAGWATANATLAREARAGAPDAASVARVTRTAGSTFAVTDAAASTLPTVQATTAGASYVAAGSVAAASNASAGKPVTMVVSERRPNGSLVREWKAKTTLTTAFKRLAVSVTASGEGNTLGVRLEQSKAASGSAFYVDDVSLRQASKVEGGAEGFTLTNDSTGTVWTGLTADAKRASRKQVSSELDVTSLVAYLDGKGGTAGSQTVKGVIYTDAGGAPGSLVGTTSQVTVKAGAELKAVELPMASPLTLAPGNYWFGLQSGGTAHVARYLSQDAAGALRTNLDKYSDGASKSFGTASAGDKAILVHAIGG